MKYAKLVTCGVGSMAVVVLSVTSAFAGHRLADRTLHLGAYRMGVIDVIRGGCNTFNRQTRGFVLCDLVKFQNSKKELRWNVAESGAIHDIVDIGGHVFILTRRGIFVVKSDGTVEPKGRVLMQSPLAIGDRIIGSISCPPMWGLVVDHGAPTQAFGGIIRGDHNSETDLVAWTVVDARQQWPALAGARSFDAADCDATGRILALCRADGTCASP